MNLTELAKQINGEEEGPKPMPSVLPAPFAKEEDNMGTKLGPKEAALRAAREDDLSIPAALDRTKDVDMGKLRTKLDKLNNTAGNVVKLKRNAPVKPSTLTETDKKNIAAIKKEQKAAADEKKQAGLAKLKAANAEKKAVRDAAKAAKLEEARKAHLADVDAAMKHADAGGDAAEARAAPKGKAASAPKPSPSGKADKTRKNAPAAAGAPKKKGYDWDAAEALAASGKLPPDPYISAGTGSAGRLVKAIAAAKAKDIGELKRFKALQPTNWSQKILSRYAALCLKALKG